MQVGGALFDGDLQQVVYMHSFGDWGLGARAKGGAIQSPAPSPQPLPLSALAGCSFERGLPERRLVRVDVGEPAVRIGHFAVDHVEKRALNRFGDGPAASLADLDFVDGFDRR